jgi:hypothetical protein
LDIVYQSNSGEYSVGQAAKVSLKNFSLEAVGMVVCQGAYQDDGRNDTGITAAAGTALGIKSGNGAYKAWSNPPMRKAVGYWKEGTPTNFSLSITATGGAGGGGGNAGLGVNWAHSNKKRFDESRRLRAKHDYGWTKADPATHNATERIDINTRLRTAADIYLNRSGDNDWALAAWARLFILPPYRGESNVIYISFKPHTEF